MQPYHEYVNFMIRQYFAHEQDFARNQQSPEDFARTVLAKAQEIARSRAEQINLNCTALVVSTLPDSTVRILREVFSTDRSDSSIAQAVRNCAEQLQISDRDAWHAVRSASKIIAQARGLI